MATIDSKFMNDECDSAHIIDVLETPNYLSFTSDNTFEKMIEENEIFHSKHNPINMETLRQMTILMYQLHIIDLEKSLWTIYYKSGTGNILKSTESTLKLWPTCVKTLIQASKRNTTIADLNEIKVNDNDCLKFVSEHLSELNEKQKQLLQKKKQFQNYTNIIEEILQKFIGQHLQTLRLQYEYKIKLIQLTYEEYVFEQTYLRQNLNEQQKQFMKCLFDRKTDYENAKEELILFNEHNQNNKLPKSLNSIQVPLPPSFESLYDTYLRHNFQDCHHDITKEYKNETMKIFIEAAEIKLRELQKLFDNEMKQFWQIQRTLPTYQRLNSTIMNLIDRHLILIANKIQCIYNYKKLQQ